MGTVRWHVLDRHVENIRIMRVAVRPIASFPVEMRNVLHDLSRCGNWILSFGPISARYSPTRRSSAKHWNGFIKRIGALPNCNHVNSRCKIASHHLETQKERLTEAYLEKVLELEEYGRRRRELEGRLMGIEQQIRELAVAIRPSTGVGKVYRPYDRFSSTSASGIGPSDL